MRRNIQRWRRNIGGNIGGRGASPNTLLDDIRSGYKDDLFATSLQSASVGMKPVSFRDGFWFIGKCLVIPKLPHIREALFHLAHDTLGHFGSDKLYAALCHSYYWPNMHKELEEFYVPSCVDCQHNKSSTMKPLSPLHPLPIPEQHSDLVAINFIGPLPKDIKFDCIVTFTDSLGSNIQIVPTSFNLTAERLADLFCDKLYCENGLPLEIISDCDKLFMSQFWKSCIGLPGWRSNCQHPTTRDRWEQRALQQNCGSVYPLPCQTQPKRMGEGPASNSL